MRRGITTVLMGMLSVGGMLGIAPLASAAVYTITSGADNVNSVPLGGVGTAVNPFQMSSLRGAIIAINTAGGSNTIMLPARTYSLTIIGSGEGLSATGDLDVLAPTVAGQSNTLTIQGSGAATTIIQWDPAVATTNRDRIFEIHSGSAASFPGSNIFTLADVTVTNAVLQTASGGAILSGRPGDVTTLTNCVFTGNVSPNNGGAISQNSNTAPTNHVLNISGCTFTNNIARSGGAVNYGAGAGGILNISNSTFSGNTASFQGGAVNATGTAPGGTYTISRCEFLNNSSADVTGGGGAISNIQGTMTVNFCRFIGNTASGGSGNAVWQQISGPTTADDNWWGLNTGPAAGAVVGTTAVSTWLQLRHSASPASVVPGGTSALTADIFGRNSGGPIAAANLVGLPAFPSPAGTIFSGATLGTLSGAATQYVNGVATATFTAGASPGSGSAIATANSQTQSAAIAIQCPTITAAVTGGGSFCGGGASTATVTVTVSGGARPYTVTLNNSGGSQLGTVSQTVFNFVVAPAGTTTYALAATSHDASSCPLAGSGSALVTVNPTPSAPPTLAIATPRFVCPGGSTVLSATVPAGQVVDWFTGSCGGTLVPGGTTPTVTPSAATTYFARARATSGDCVSAACASVTVTICKADYNCSGTTTVQDIFDFLSGWFAADPRANFNGVNGITVQDIFDFLAAWFAGC